MSLEFVELGASTIDDNGVVRVQSKGEPITEDEVPDLGQIPLMSSLGLVARPAPANTNGAAQGLAARVPGGHVLVGGADARTAKVYGELGPGETALYATGENFEARVFCKDQRVCIFVGDDVALDLDRKGGQVSLNAFGQVFAISKEGGLTMSSGQATLQVVGPNIVLDGVVVVGGREPGMQLLAGPPTNPAGHPVAPGTPIPFAKGIYSALQIFLAIGIGAALAAYV